VIRRLPGGQLQNSHLLPAAEAADIGRQSGISADGASFVVLNIPWLLLIFSQKMYFTYTS
jgi:hypothetical protein